MKIITEYCPKPIPNRNYDWDAWDSDLDENSPIGHGITEDESIINLLEKLDDYDDNSGSTGVIQKSEGPDIEDNV